MIVNQAQSNKFIAEANKCLEVLKDKKYLELTHVEKAAIKDIYNRIKVEVKSYQSPNTSLLGVFNELTSVLADQEGFFWKYTK